LEKGGLIEDTGITFRGEKGKREERDCEKGAEHGKGHPEDTDAREPSNYMWLKKKT